MSLVPERARPQDLAPALELIRACGLPVEGVVEQFGHYFVVRDDGLVVAVCGLELHGDQGLLRSAAVMPDYRGQGVGAALVEAVLELAERLKLEDVYLLTTDARDYFAARGFEDLPRDRAPTPIRESWEFRAGCPSSARLMKRARP